MAAVTPESGFIIDGSRYEVPTLDTFTTEEARVLYDYSGLALEDFVPLAEPPKPKDEDDLVAQALYEDQLEERKAEIDELEKKLRNPGFLQALIHVAYQRANPGMNPSRVKSAVGSADYTENWMAFIEGNMGDDAVPPALTTEREQSSPRESVVKPDISGQDSTKSSEGQAGLVGVTTTGASVTSLDSPHQTLATLHQVI